MPETINPKLISWASDIDPETIRQAEKTARLPIVEGHVALMPDAHVGIGATVGSVIPTIGAVIPSAVGVDIGCGMIAAELDVTESQLPDNLEPLLSRIERAVPAGVGQGHAGKRGAAAESAGQAADAWLGTHRPATVLSEAQAKKSASQFGSLGSGNHFFELCVDERARVWVVLHSGSRGIGNQLAQAHIATAKRLAKEAMLSLEDPDLAWFVQGTPEFDAYVTDMLWAQDYALANRSQMMDAAIAEVLAFIGMGAETRRINCLAGETKVMTQIGIQQISELAGGTHELLTSGGLWVKAPVQSFGRQHLLKLTVSRNKVSKVIHATPGHRWLLRTATVRGDRVGRQRSQSLTSELLPGDRLAFAYPNRSAGMRVDREGVARGFVFGDGSSSPHSAIANFCGSKDQEMLSFFADKRQPRTYGSVRRVSGLPRSWKKEYPELESDDSYLYGWLAGYFAADGDVGKTGRPTIVSANREHLEFVKILCTRIGLGTFGIRERYGGSFGGPDSRLYLMGLMRGDLDEDFFLISSHRMRFAAGRKAWERRGWTVRSVEDTGRVDEVFCAIVEGTHCFALEDNILTGNCHHNFSQPEVHDGRELWVTRKGAIRADTGDLGVIPGSMGTRSYIVAGKGSAASWKSCSHGAGRRYSRTKARKLFSPADLAEQMSGKTWLKGRAAALVDEIPTAYKDIDQVMADQADLVEVLHTLHQVLNYKGT